MLLLAGVLFFIPRSKAQPDTISKDYFTVFQQNIDELSGSWFFSDSTFYRGKFKFEKVYDFSGKYESLKFSVFQDVLKNSGEYFRQLNSLSEREKKDLIRLFSFYEKDFEAALKKDGIPVELKYMAPAVSALNSKAVGTEKRAGVWQLTHFQAFLNGGEVTRLVDDRMNIQRETKLATLQLKRNFEIYDDWELAVMAFLSGNTLVKNAMYFTGGETNISAILNQLPEVVSDQIEAFQALSVFFAANRFILTPDFSHSKNLPDTVMVYRQLHFKQIEKVIGIPVTQIQALNSQFKFSIVPGSSEGKKLALPAGEKNNFVLWNDSINNALDSTYFQLITQRIEYPPLPNRQYVGERVKDLEIEGKTKIKYRLKTGDVLGVIAETYDVHVADLKYWNNITNERRIQAGQMIDIFVPDDQAEYYGGLENQKPEETGEKNNVIDKIQNSSTLKVYEQFDSTRKIEHIVKSGESPFIIAKQYEGVTPELILEWNHIDNPRKIQIGQKLIIYPQK